MGKKRPERQYKMKGDVLAARMKEKGYSQAALADKLCINVSTVGRWLDGHKAFLRNIVEVAKILDIPTHRIAYGLEEPDANAEANIGHGGTAVLAALEELLMTLASDKPLEAIEHLRKRLQERGIRIIRLSEEP